MSVTKTSGFSDWIVNVSSSDVKVLSSWLDTVCSMLATWRPSCTASSTAATVTVCGVFQLAGVNVSWDEPLLSAVTWESAFRVTTTFALGWLARRTSYVSVAPPSITSVDPSDCVITTPAVSLSITSTPTLGTASPL